MLKNGIDHVKTVMMKMMDIYERGENVDAMAVISMIEDQKIHEIVSILMFEEDWLNSDKDKIFSDLVQRFRMNHAKHSRQELIHAMREAEQEGDNEKLENLKHQFNQSLQTRH